MFRPRFEICASNFFPRLSSKLHSTHTMATVLKTGSRVVKSGVETTKNVLKASHLVLATVGVLLVMGAGLAWANSTETGKSVLENEWVKPALPALAIAFLASVIGAFQLERIFQGGASRPSVSLKEFSLRFGTLFVVVYGVHVAYNAVGKATGIETFKFCPEE